MSRFIDEHRGRFGVEPICRTLGVSASAYYQRATGQRSARAVEDERLLGRIRDLHAANYYAYGYRRMWKALLRAGESAPRCRVQRLMRIHGIVGAKRRGRPWRTTRPNPRATSAPIWCDATSPPQGRMSCGSPTVLPQVLGGPAVLRLRHRCLLAPCRRLAARRHMRTTLVLDALRMALGRAAGADVDLVHHSIAGSQYTSYAFTQVLDDHAVLASIGSVDDALRQRAG